jgi:hypothetical protein
MTKKPIDKANYFHNKAAKIGELLYCPSCGHPFIKKCHQQAFCQTKGGTICKDRYWNRADPRKRNNTTRISPANAAWMARREDERETNYRSIYSSFHPLEGLNDEDYKNH